LPLDIAVGPSTKFEGGGIHDLGDWKVGIMDVDGFTGDNGSIFAVKVKFNRPK
jgi:hypothetical protein